jgi:hypothetical protein
LDSPSQAGPLGVGLGDAAGFAVPGLGVLVAVLVVTVGPCLTLAVGRNQQLLRQGEIDAANRSVALVAHMQARMAANWALAAIPR